MWQEIPGLKQTMSMKPVWKLQNVFKNLRGKGVVTEKDIDAAMRDVKLALLEADVNYTVVKQFVDAVRTKCVGQNILKGVNPRSFPSCMTPGKLLNVSSSVDSRDDK